MTIYAELLRAVNVQVRDLSANGCLLETRAFLPVGTVGVLDMELGGERRAEWFRTCRIQATQGRSGVYLVGAEFLPLAAAGELSLRGAVRRMKVVPSHKISAQPGRLSGDPGKSAGASARPPASSPTRSRVLLPQTDGSDATAVQAEVGSAVAPLPCADAARMGASDDGEVFMKRLIVRLVRDDQGQDLIEYVLIGSFVSIGALAGATALGTNLNGWYTSVAGWVTTASSSVP